MDEELLPDRILETGFHRPPTGGFELTRASGYVAHAQSEVMETRPPSLHTGRYDHQPHGQNHQGDDEGSDDQSPLEPVGGGVGDYGVLRMRWVVANRDGVGGRVRGRGDIVDGVLLAVRLEKDDAPLFARRRAVPVPDHEVGR